MEERAHTVKPLTASRELRPVKAAGRVELIDLLRGFAILGILLVNQQMFFSPIYLYLTEAEWWTATIDVVAQKLIIFLAQGKFYSMFSMLFGLGMSIQFERATARGRPFGPFFARRMFVLLLIGLAHALLLWYGDILALYALTGFVLILFRNRSPKTLLVWTIILLLIPLGFLTLAIAALQLVQLVPDIAAQVEADLAQSAQDNLAAIEVARVVYAEGSWAEIFSQRVKQLGVIYSMSFFWLPNVLAMFLIGLNLGRRRILHEPALHLAFIRRAWIWLLALGVVGNGVMIATMDRVDPAVPSPLSLVNQVLFSVGAPALSLFYVASIALLVQRETWRRRLQPVVAVGRMALTNYLMHSLVFTTLANAYGFGLYGRISHSSGLALTVAMFLLQIPLSNWWLRRFRFGPAEWLWRSLTYGKLQPMRGQT